MTADGDKQTNEEATVAESSSNIRRQFFHLENSAKITDIHIDTLVENGKKNHCHTANYVPLVRPRFIDCFFQLCYTYVFHIVIAGL